MTPCSKNKVKQAFKCDRGGRWTEKNVCDVIIEQPLDKNPLNAANIFPSASKQLQNTKKTSGANITELIRDLYLNLWKKLKGSLVKNLHSLEYKLYFVFYLVS